MKQSTHFRYLLALIVGFLIVILTLGNLQALKAMPSLNTLYLLNLFPAQNAHNVPATTTISISYNQTISPAAVSSQTVVVYAMQTGLISAEYRTVSNTITFTPTQSFKPGELVQVSATTQTRSLSGQQILSPTVWQFSIGVTPSSGVFTATGQTFPLNDSEAIDLGDLDGDGDIDAFISSGYDSLSNTVWLNNGWGYFSDSGQRMGNASTEGVALGDLDADGDLDAVIANIDAPDEVWFNNGYGVFTDSGQRLTEYGSADVALGDMDGDGDLDAVVATLTGGESTPQANLVWLNDGQGIFSDSGQRLGSSPSGVVTLGDLDNDGDLDAFFASTWFIRVPGHNEVWLNNGQGVFTESGQIFNYDDKGNDVALADVDNDGDLDAVIADDYGELWFNNGQAIFTITKIFTRSFSYSAITSNDLNGDGNLDILISRYHTTETWFNDGGGTFISGTQLIHQDYVNALAIADLDNDGDLDAITSDYSPLITIWLNDNDPFSKVYLPLLVKP